MLAGDDAVTVYVYRLKGQRPIAPMRELTPPWYGLTADTEDELHPFAEALGLYRHFYRPRDPVGPQRVSLVGHYDLDEGERYSAVAQGAQSISARQLGKMLLRRSAGLETRAP